MRDRRTLVGLLWLAAVALLAACGGGGGDSDVDRNIVWEDEEGDAVLRVEGEDFSFEGPEGEVIFTTGEDLVEGFPLEIAYPRGTLTHSAMIEEEGRPQFVAFWDTDDAAETVLDFYDAAFEALGLGGERERSSFGGIATLIVGAAESGATVVFDQGSGQNGRNIVNVWYFPE